MVAIILEVLYKVKDMDQDNIIAKMINQHIEDFGHKELNKVKEY